MIDIAERSREEEGLLWKGIEVWKSWRVVEMEGV